MARQENPKVPPFQGYAPCRWRIGWAGEMDEYGAAAAPYAWPRIMVDFDDEIVQMIGAA